MKMHANKTFRHITVMLNILQMILNCQKKRHGIKKNSIILFYAKFNLLYYFLHFG